MAGLFSFCLIWVMLGAAVAEAAFTACFDKEVCNEYGYCSVEQDCSKHDSYVSRA